MSKIKKNIYAVYFFIIIRLIGKIDDPTTGKSYVFSHDGKPGPVCEKLYKKLRNIQYGIEPDIHNWNLVLD